MASSSLLRPGLKTAFAEALYNEIVSNTSGYYYFVGRPQGTTTGVGATLASENEVRRDAVFFKKITGADVTLTIPRVNWESGTVYDIYDDQLGDYAEVVGQVSRAIGTFNPGGTDVNSGATGAITVAYLNENEFVTGDLVLYSGSSVPVNGLTFNSYYYCRVIQSNPAKIQLFTTQANAVAGTNPIAISPTGVSATHSFTRNSVTGSYDLDTFGEGWTVQILVDGTLSTLGTVVSGSTGAIVLSSSGDLANGASETLTITNKSFSGARYLEDANFYVMNSEYNVYKCLDNNNNSPSTVRPYSTSHEPFQTADGYVWKFMYSIPTALVNKFLSDIDIPVATAVKNPYYSNGAINAVQVIKQGSNYSTSDGLLVLGDGSRAENVYRLVALTIKNNGSGYGTGATGILIDPPVSADPWQASTAFTAGQHLIVNSSNIVYRVIAGGVSGTIAPTHTFGTATNGTMSVKFVGIRAAATVTHTAGATGYQISTSSFTNGNVGYINVSNPGSGYIVPPQVQIYGGGTGALASSTLTGAGYVANIVVSAKGTGYPNGTTATIAAPPSGGSQAYATVDVYNGYGYKDIPSVTVPAPFTADLQYKDGATGIHNQIFQYGTKFFRVVGATGYLGTDVPTAGATGFTAGATGPTVSYTFIGETASIEVFTEKTKALLSPVVYNGQIVGTIVQDGGAGYTTATVTPLSGTGSGAELFPSLSYGDLDTYQATTELMAMPGTIDKIVVMHSGYGYATGSTGVTVTGDGSDCSAYAIVTNGLVSKIVVTDPGQGYTYANVTIASPLSGTRAIGRAIIAPATGHGRDAVKELFAKDIVLGTTLAGDLNQGILVSNDYSQVGIVKNPEDYTTGLRYNDQTGSPCFVLGATGVNGFAGISVDMIVSDSVTNDRYRVVQPSTDFSSILVQSLDNKVPVVGDTLLLNSSPWATVGAVTVPNIDKYSGQLLYVDTESSSFNSSADQTISVKTVIRL